MKRLAAIQEQATSTKRINRPSDDPVGTEKALTLRSRIRSGEATLENLSTTDEWLSANSSALESVSSLVTEVQNTALEGANDTLGVDERAALAAEIDGYLEELVDLSNTKYGDSYIFSGFKTDTEPFELTRDAVTDEITGFTYVGDDGEIVREIESGTETTVNVTGGRSVL